MRHTQEGADLRKEVFDYLPGTVNTRRGAAVYDTQDQAFSFRKQVRFGDRSQVPDLKSDADSEDQSSVGQNVPQSSTPHCGAKPMNQTFDISHIPPMTGSPQDVQQLLQLKFQRQWLPRCQRSSAGCGTQKLPSSRVDIWLMPN